MPLDFRQIAGFMKPDCSVIRNTESSGLVPITGADRNCACEHTPLVTRDWHLQSWMAFAKKRQAHLVSELGWSRRRASEVFNGDQQYKRDTVNELATWLGIEPFELLMPPEEAFALRQLREHAVRIAQDVGATPVKTPPANLAASAV